MPMPGKEVLPLSQLQASRQRRALILQVLAATAAPVPARDLAERCGVSRQVIVQDVAVLRAAAHQIIATAAGYIMPPAESVRPYKQILAVRHRPEQTEDELNALVDAGVRVVDVIVEHPLYGELRGVLMLETRDDVARFMARVRRQGASLLSQLTDGLHLHTIEAAHPARLQAAQQAMAERGYLVNEGTFDPQSS